MYLQLTLFSPPAPAFPTGEPAWAVAFSGGKDSTALAFLALDAAARLVPPPKVAVVYGDTGMEIPPLRERAMNTLAALREEAAALGVPLEVAVAAPPPERDFCTGNCGGTLSVLKHGHGCVFGGAGTGLR